MLETLGSFLTSLSHFLRGKVRNILWISLAAINSSFVQNWIKPESLYQIPVCEVI